MKKIILSLCLIASCAGAFTGRSIYRTNSADGYLDRQNLRVYQNESIEYNLWSTNSAGVVDLSGSNVFCVWYWVATTNNSLTYLVQTGSVVVATNGSVQINVAPTNSNVTADRYYSYVRAFDEIGGTNTYIGTLAANYIDVLSSPDAAGYAVMAPVDLNNLVQSNEMGAGSAWNGTNWTFASGSIDLSGLSNDVLSAWATGSNALTIASAAATGTPLYVESYTGSVGSLTGMATGTPIYTESDPVWVSEKGSYATGTPLYVYTETDQIWTNAYAAGLDLSTMTNAPAAWTNSTGGGDTFATNVLANLADVDAPVPTADDVLTWDGSVWTNAAAAGGSDTGAVQKTGDTMTGVLTVPGLYLTSQQSANVIAISNALSYGIMIGNVGTFPGDYQVHIGTGLSAAYGTAVGYDSDVSQGAYGTAIGYYSEGGDSGAAVGWLAVGSYYGASVGAGSSGNREGAALGYGAKGACGGVAIGNRAFGYYSNICIGTKSYAGDGYGQLRITIGANTTNDINNSARIRGDMYLDGATGVQWRTTFSTGNWEGMYSDGTNLFFRNSTGGVEQVTSM